jgi:peroxiredoxin
MKKQILSVFALAASITIVSAQADTTTLTKIGQNAPAFTCKTVDGKSFDISKLKGKIVMINFFATWCGPCNMELPVLEKNVWTKYKGNKNFELIIIGREHSDKEVKDFVTKKSFSMPFAADPERKIYSLYATQFIPRNVIIGKDGRIIFQGQGYSPEEFKKIEELLAENLK